MYIRREKKIIFEFIIVYIVLCMHIARVNYMREDKCCWVGTHAPSGSRFGSGSVFVVRVLVFQLIAISWRYWQHAPLLHCCNQLSFYQSISKLYLMGVIEVKCQKAKRMYQLKLINCSLMSLWWLYAKNTNPERKDQTKLNARIRRPVQW